MRLSVVPFLVVLSLLLTGASARATVVVPLDFNELAVSSDAIAYARVIDVRAVASGDRSRVESVVTVEAIGYLKGDLGRSIVFRVPGGQIGAYRTIMLGAPRFEPGEEVVLFFRRAATAPASPVLVGFNQGVFRVRADERTGARVVLPAPAVNTGQTVTLRRGTRAPMPLDAFAAEVKALVAGGAR